ncbi:hypothetical protein BRD01_00800 [Halobacteriales archaeon QS_8_65_32]|nr:MAG: hypothetical protein BRD01_00800 [Halobacteriales archaeon QS_8_65_32]
MRNTNDASIRKFYAEMTYMDVSFRLTIAVFVVLAPTALFLGLWHGLTSLRDDDLAGEVTARQLRGVFDALPSGQPDAGRFEGVPNGGIDPAVGGSREAETPTPTEPRAVEPGTVEPTPAESGAVEAGTAESEAAESGIEIGVEPDPVECSRCEELNPAGAELCWGCGGYIEDAVGSE